MSIFDASGCLPRSPVRRRRRQRDWQVHHDGSNFPYTDELALVDYSVINRQTRLRQCFGISRLRFTQGLTELHELEREQGAAKRAGKPHFIRLDKDLSAQRGLHVYLWRQFELKSIDTERPVDVVTSLQLCRRPVGGKLKQQQI